MANAKVSIAQLDAAKSIAGPFELFAKTFILEFIEPPPEMDATYVLIPIPYPLASTLFPSQLTKHHSPQRPHALHLSLPQNPSPHRNRNVVPANAPRPPALRPERVLRRGYGGSVYAGGLRCARAYVEA